MNWNNNTYNEKEVKNKLKDFKEGKDYSIVREDKKLIYNFHSDWLRNEFGRNYYTTVYEVAENWDSDNFNHHREEGKYINNDKGTEITYRYEHRINKDLSGYREWSWGKNFEDNSKHTWTLRGRPNPKRIENGFNDGFFLPGNFKNDEELKHQERLNGSRLQTLKRDRKEFEEKLTHYESLPAKEERTKDTLSLKDKINYLRKEIEEEKDWINRNNLQQIVQNGRNEKGKFITDKEENNHSDLHKQNQELRQELAEVKKQLTEVLAELKKLKNGLNGKDSDKLEEQIVQNEKLIKDDKNISLDEVQEQVNKSQALMNELNTTSSPSKENGNNPLPYIIGGSVILVSAGIIGYYLLKKNKKK